MTDRLTKPTVVTDATFKQEVLQSPTPVLVDFGAPWCPPCRALDPVLDEVAREQAGALKVAKVNVDENEHLANQYRVSGLPTLLLFKDGRQVERLVGFLPKPRLLARLQQHLAA